MRAAPTAKYALTHKGLSLHDETYSNVVSNAAPLAADRIISCNWQTWQLTPPSNGLVTPGPHTFQLTTHNSSPIHNSERTTQLQLTTPSRQQP